MDLKVCKLCDKVGTPCCGFRNMKFSPYKPEYCYNWWPSEDYCLWEMYGEGIESICKSFTLKTMKYEEYSLIIELKCKPSVNYLTCCGEVNHLMIYMERCGEEYTEVYWTFHHIDMKFSTHC